MGLFVVETKSTDGRWRARDSAGSIQAAQERAWQLLAQEGGKVRVRQGARIVAQGCATIVPRAKP